LYPAQIKRKQALTIALVVCALACCAGLRAAPAPAQGDAVQKFNEIQSKLDDTNAKQGVLTTTISHYTSRIKELRGQIDGLQAREHDVQVRLNAVQAQLDAAVARLVELRAHLHRAIDVLGARLVAIYKSSEPDMLTIVLESHGFDDLLSQSDYLSRIQTLDSDIVNRVRDLRDETQSTVEQIRSAREEIAARKSEIDHVRVDLVSRNRAMKTAREHQRGALKRVKTQKDALEGDLSKVSDEIAKQLGGLGVAGPIQDGGHGFIWPVNGPITSGFGARDIGAGYEFHPGIDIAVPTGTGIRAAAAGTVTIAAPTGGYGNYTCIDHGGGVSTCYGHQESFAVVPGMHVAQGQIIGRSDCTGYCTGPHVHFEVRINGQVTNPLNYF
jgi:murein DD-endopeptidase MepM/ murein hydrolase activator NlpD